MTDYPLVADVSSHQPDDLAYFKMLKNNGVQAVIVKLTEGSNPGSAYLNPKAANQIANTVKLGMRVHAYHFARYVSVADALLEAHWFISCAKKLGITNDAVMAVDVEANDVCVPATAATNAFLHAVQKAGYPRVDVYTGASWIWDKRLLQIALDVKNLWIANWGVSQPGVDRVGTWQFTDRWHGLKQDMSYDFFGYYTNGAPSMSLDDIYTVRPGDSWWLIAYNHAIGMHALARINGKTINDMLHPGDRLRVR